MRRTFADSLYWIAVTHPRDQWHDRAMAAGRALRGVVIVTTEEVLTEFLAAFRFNAMLRRTAYRAVARLQNDPAVLILPQSHQSFTEGLALYAARLDKQYSLTDCISMAAMRREVITEVLTHDAHFAQEGFTILL
jgi:predicted nucleic acid-binding protein